MLWLLSVRPGLSVGFLLLQYSVKSYVMLRPYLCFSPFYVDLYVLGNDAWIS